MPISIHAVIYVMVGTDKPLARQCVVCHLGVDKGLKLRSGILDTLFNTLYNTQRKGGRRQELKIVYSDDFEYVLIMLMAMILLKIAIDWKSLSNSIFEIKLTLL